MRVYFGEIQSLLKRLDSPKDCHISLCVGTHKIERVTPTMIAEMWKSGGRSAEIMSWLFLDRDLFWMPVMDSIHIGTYLSQLGMFGFYCERIITRLREKDKSAYYLYASLIGYLLKVSEKVKKDLSKNRLPQLLGRFRQTSFPLLVFFAEHPKLDKNQKREAYRKMDHMVKMLVRDLSVPFSDIRYPHWEISFSSRNPSSRASRPPSSSSSPSP